MLRRCNSILTLLAIVLLMCGCRSKSVATSSVHEVRNDSVAHVLNSSKTEQKTDLSALMVEADSVIVEFLPSDSAFVAPPVMAPYRMKIYSPRVQKSTSIFYASSDTTSRASVAVAKSEIKEDKKEEKQRGRSDAWWIFFAIVAILILAAFILEYLNKRTSWL